MDQRPCGDDVEAQQTEFAENVAEGSGGEGAIGPWTGLDDKPAASGSRPAPVQTADGAMTGSKKQVAPRLHVLDNTKFFLTMLVVAEHTGSMWVGKSWLSSAFHPMTLSFLMPTYVFISGYTSATDLSQVRKVDGIIKVGAIYLMCQALMLLLVRYGRGWLDTTAFGASFEGAGRIFMYEHGKCEACWKFQDLLIPFWALWYLLYLVVWRFILPFWWRLRWPLLSAWVWGAALSCFKIYRNYGADSPWQLRLDEVFAWFPLFVLGAVAKERKWQLWEHPRSRLAGMAVLAALVWVPMVQTIPWGQPLSTWTPAALCPTNFGGIQAETWHYVDQMDTMNRAVGDGPWGRLAKTAVRMGAGLLQACCVWGILHVMPRKERRIITSYGARSLANYVFHPLSGMLMSYLGVYGSNLGDAPWWGEPLVFLMVIPTSVFWMSPWVWKLAWPILDPPIHWVLKPCVAPAAQAEEKGTARIGQDRLPTLLTNQGRSDDNVGKTVRTE